MGKKNSCRGFTLTEVMIVILIIGLLMMIAIPQFLSARSSSQANTCAANLRQIEYGKELFAGNNKLKDGDPCDMNDLWPAYIKCPGKPACPGGGTYTINVIGTQPTCSVGGPKPHVLP